MKRFCLVKHTLLAVDMQFPGIQGLEISPYVLLT